MIEIFDSRIAFIAGQCFFDHQWASAPTGEFVLWSFVHYREEFNQVRGGNEVVRYDLPWRQKQRSTFWSHYLGLGDGPLAEVSAQEAWDELTPLRLVAFQSKALTTDQAERIVVDCYGYPHGLVAAVTVHGPAKQPEKLDDWRARLCRLRMDPVFQLDLGDGRGAQQLTIDRVLDSLLEWHRREYYPDATQVRRSHSPITLNMVVQADGVNPALPFDRELQRTIHAVTAWPKTWQTVTLPELGAKDTFLPVGKPNEGPGDAVYAVSRARTWWRPGLFARRKPGDRGRRLHTLSCLFHNGIAGAVQTEALRLFAIGYAQWSAAAKRLDPAYVRKIARLIEAVHLGASGTYRSLSLSALLADTNSKDQVEALLAAKGFKPIGPVAPQVPPAPPPPDAAG